MSFDNFYNNNLFKYSSYDLLRNVKYFNTIIDLKIKLEELINDEYNKLSYTDSNV